ncbi:MAG: hypothetical protein ACOC3F_03895, partial [Desulfosudaceae bacterium]
MKKFIVLTTAICVALAVAIPAMAVDVDFSGYYRVRGFMNSNITLSDDGAESEAYYDNRFRLQTVFTANDNVSVTTRFDAYDSQWGNQNEEYIDFDRIYMDIKTDYGLFKIGHQQAGVWGLDFFDDDYNDDRIKYVGKSGDIIFGAIIQKTEETDSVNAWNRDPDDDVGVGEADGDLDVYYGFGIYKKDNIEAGLLGAWARDARTADMTMNKQALLPYWDLTFGPMGFKGEIVYEMGEMDYDAGDDTDIDALSYALEGSFNLDMARLYAGWVSVSGQDQSSDDMTAGNLSYGGLGDDYNPFAILTDDLGAKMLNSHRPADFQSLAVKVATYEAQMEAWVAGGMVGPQPAAPNVTLEEAVAAQGTDMWYLGADVTVNDKLTVNTILGQAMANEDHWAKVDGIDDDEYGMELDVGATYQIMDNLQYSATLAYLMTGDM